MKIEQVTVEGMHKVDKATYTFDDVTYLYGPNGSGKSTILQAIQLCLLGYIPGTSKVGTAIFAHSNNNNFMKVGVVLRDDTEIITVTRTLMKSGAKVLNDVVVTPEVDLQEIIGSLELPILNFNDFLGLTANKQKDLLMSVLPSSKSVISTREFLKSIDGYTADCEEIVAELEESHSSLNNIDEIKAVNADLKERKSMLEGELKRVTSTTQSLIFYDDYAGEADVDVIQSRIRMLMKEKDEATKKKAQREAYASQLEELKKYEDLTAESEMYDENYLSRDNRLKELSEVLEMLQGDIVELNQGVAELQSSVTQNQRIIDSRGICPFIQYDCDKLEAKISDLEKLNAEFVNASNYNLQKVAEKKQRISEINIEKAQIERELQEIASRYSVRNNLRRMVADVPEDAITADPEFLGQQIQQLNDDLIKASSNAKYNEVLDTIQRQKLQLEPQLEFVKAAIKRTGENGLQTELMIQPFVKLSEIMYQVMMDLELTHLGSPQFNLEAKANSFTFGFMRTTFVPFHLLSSGEKCIFTVVFMTAVARIANSKVQTIMIDDLFDHLDSNRFETVISNITKLSSDLQFIIAGVNKIAIGDSVKLIDLGDQND